ncbi:MAG: glycine cleavage system protein GcvH [Actinomycetaceae bacterium]|nr:glycine cleavage system protein GcvH [Actinomycetaceae bacterium]
MSYPNDRKYTEDHEWITSDSPARVGITEFAANALDEAVYIDLPDVGDEVTAGEACGEIESVKSVSDLVAPASGTVTAINEEAVDDPKKVTDDPHSTWLYEVEVSQLPDLLDAQAYEAIAKEQ